MLNVVLAVLLGTGLVSIAALQELSPPPFGRRALASAGLSWAVRLSAVLLAIGLLPAIQKNTVWLNDEEAFHRATVGLLPNPWDQDIPIGLQHLAGSAYMGITTALYLVFGPDPNVLRVTNAVVGAMVAVACMRIAARRFGGPASIAAALFVGLWPPLIFFSILIVRDTLVSLSVVACWWSTVAWSSGMRLRAAGVAGLSLVLAAELRPYVAALLVLGLAIWAVHPLIRRLSWPALAALGGSALVVLVVVQTVRPAIVRDLVLQVTYRQMATRMELLGRLYNLGQGEPFVPGPYGPAAPVAIHQGGGADDLPGVIQRRPDATTAVVAFNDDSVRTLPISELLPFQLGHYSVRGIFQNYAASVLDVLTGMSDTAEGAGRVVWIADALLADLALVVAVVAVARRRASPEIWIMPVVLAVGTILVLAMVPGAPGNAARHRDTQSLPLLLVLIAGSPAVRLPRFSAVRRRTVGQCPPRPSAPVLGLAGKEPAPFGGGQYGPQDVERERSG